MTLSPLPPGYLPPHVYDLIVRKLADEPNAAHVAADLAQQGVFVKPARIRAVGKRIGIQFRRGRPAGSHDAESKAQLIRDLISSNPDATGGEIHRVVECSRQFVSQVRDQMGLPSRRGKKRATRK